MPARPTILHKTVSELCVHSVYKGDSHGRAEEMLCKRCANLGIKKVKVLKISTLTLAVVGHHRPGHRHHRSLAPSGTFPRRRHLLRHRLSDRHPDHLIQKCQFYILLRFRFWITRRILLPLQAEMTNTVISRKTVII